jgi:hypothetical protein
MGVFGLGRPMVDGPSDPNTESNSLFSIKKYLDLTCLLGLRNRVDTRLVQNDRCDRPNENHGVIHAVHDGRTHFLIWDGTSNGTLWVYHCLEIMEVFLRKEI